MDDKRYWAFLSYSHADRRWAQWFHRALEGYAVPRRLIGRPTAMGPAPPRLRPIFRDREDLEANPHLGERITRALEQSAWLIVVCSPAAARSRWVNDEIVRFKAVHGEDRVLAVIVAGEPHAGAGREAEECFPPALRRRVAPDATLTDIVVEPTAADVRPGKDGRRLARLKLLAGMLEVGLDDLVHRDAQRRAVQMAGLAAVLGVVSAGMTALAVAAVAERDAARAQRAQAEGLVEFMLGDLRKKLEPSSRLDVLDAVGAKALSYYASEEPYGLDDEALGRRARVLHLLGDIRVQRGDLAGALKDFQEAAGVTARLLARQPDDGTRIFNHAQSVFYIGDLAGRRGQDGEAEQAFLTYQRLAGQLVKLDPRRDDWRAEVVYANENLGALWLRQSRYPQATAAFTQALAADLDLARRAPADRDRQTDLASVYAFLADAEAGQQDLAGARRDRLSERAIYNRLLALQPGDNAVKLLMVHNGLALAAVDNQSARTNDAAGELAEATGLAERLMVFQPDNTAYRQQAASAYLMYARTLLSKGDAAAARPAADRALTLAEDLARKDPTVADWHGYLLGAARLMQIRIAAQQARSLDALRSALQPAVAESGRLAVLVSPGRPDIDLGRVSADALLLAGDGQLLAGRADLARAAWTRAAAVCVCVTLDRPAFGDRHGGPDVLGRSRIDDLAALTRPGDSRPRLSLGDLKRRWFANYLW